MQRAVYLIYQGLMILPNHGTQLQDLFKWCSVLISETTYKNAASLLKAWQVGSCGIYRENTALAAPFIRGQR